MHLYHIFVAACEQVDKPNYQRQLEYFRIAKDDMGRMEKQMIYGKK